MGRGNDRGGKRRDARGGGGLEVDARAIAAAAASAREAASGKAVEIPREADRVSLTAGCQE